ncbi:MAG: helix-turn-helix domain-containing protein [Sphingobacterium sp.]
MYDNFLEKINQDKHEILSFQMNPEHFDFHAHIKAQLTLIEGGLSYLHTLDRTYFIPSYHFVWIPPGQIHRFSHQHKQHVLVRNLFIPLPLERDRSYFDEIGIFPAHPLLIESLKFTGNAVFKKNDEHYTFLNSLLLLLPNLSPEKLTLNLPNSQHHILGPIVDYIMNNLSKELRLHPLAAKFNIGVRTLSRLFEKELHTSFIQYIKTARIIKSMELILTNKMSISEISYAVGYKSISAFSNAFILMTGKRPTEFGKTLS